ncbi:MAG TPA: hypothetical protein PLY93_03895 [Turneriella sp.]|nr:hypothetical protein [Turneriella sp.]
MLQSLDFNRAFEDAAKGYAKNFAMAALILFVSFILILLSIFSFFGMFFALPNLVAGISLVSYYMTKEKIGFSTIFSGFKSYWSVVGAMHIYWTGYLLLYLIFSAPYYYHFISIFADTLNFSGSIDENEILKAFIAASTASSVQNAALFQYLAYPIQFYLQGRLLPLFPLIVDERLSIPAAFKKSWSMTRRVQWQLLLFIFLTMLIAFVSTLAGMLALFVGIFFTLPFSLALVGAATKQLMEAANNYTQLPAAIPHPTAPL